MERGGAEMRRLFLWLMCRAGVWNAGPWVFGP